MISAVRRIQFCSGHRVMNHESKCATVHGHNYVMYIHAVAEELDRIGRVIDFSELKLRAGAWIDENWDHNMIVFKEDVDLVQLMKMAPRKKDPFIMDSNPTAENMANFFLRIICPQIFDGTGIFIYKVVLWETENCYVEAERG